MAFQARPDMPATPATDPESDSEDAEYNDLVHMVESFDEDDYMYWLEGVMRAMDRGRATPAERAVVRRVIAANQGIQPVG